MSRPVTAGIEGGGTAETRTKLWFVLESAASALVSPQQKLQPFVGRKKPLGSWVIKKLSLCQAPRGVGPEAWRWDRGIPNSV